MKPRTHVILADSTRARFFTLETKRGQAGEPTPALREHLDLVQPGRRMRPSEKLRDSRPGSRRGSVNSDHTVDDHRGDKAEEADRRFANEVIEKLRELRHGTSADTTLVVASNRFLGHLRASSERLGGCGELRFVPLDLSELTATRALEHLTSHGHLVTEGTKQ